MRLLLGIWLIQVLTALVFWLGLDGRGWYFALSATIALGMGALATLWIQSTLKDQIKINEARFGERLAQKSEQYRAELSRHKMSDADRLAELAKSSGYSRITLLRVGILTGGALGIGAALIMAQLVGMALLLVAFSSGGIAGFFLSSKTGRSKRAELDVSRPDATQLALKVSRLSLKAASK